MPEDAPQMLTLETLGARVSLLTDSGALIAMVRERLGFSLGEGRADVILEARFAPGPPQVALGERCWDLSESAAEEQAFGALFRTLLDHVDAAIVLHAAVLVDDDRTLLVAGPSGSGKTTLTLALIERGFRLLSDDFAPLDRESGEILPFLKSAGLRPGVGQELAARSLDAGQDAPRHVDWESLAPAARGTSGAVPTHLVLIVDPRLNVGPAAPYAFSVVCAGDPSPVRDALTALPGVDELELLGSEIVLRIDPATLDAAALERQLDTLAPQLLEYGVVASLEQDPQRTATLEPLETSSALMLLAREIQNRRSGSRLMASVGGDPMALYTELARLLGHCQALSLVPGEARDTAQVLDLATQPGSRS